MTRLPASLRHKRTRAVLLLIALVLLSVAEQASAQFFSRPRQPMRRAREMIGRQEPPRIRRELAAVVTPDNASVRISLSRQRAYLMAGDEVYIDTPISSGKKAGSTPTGTFEIVEKDPDHRSNIYGDFVDRRGRVVRAGVSLKVDSAPSGTHYVGAPMRWFMRLTWSGIGMHVGILPGYPASHGCIRLPSEVAALMYQKVKIGTPVTIDP